MNAKRRAAGKVQAVVKGAPKIPEYMLDGIPVIGGRSMHKLGELVYCKRDVWASQ